MKREIIRLTVNGEERELASSGHRLLLEVLREDLLLTGAKRGCDDSSCGACAVLVDGEPILSCVALAASYQGRAITTVECLCAAGVLDPVQEGFATEGGSSADSALPDS